MARPNNGGGSRQASQTNNETISLQQQLQFVLGQIVVRKEEIAAVLPPDLPFDRFHATINQALRNNPEILKCTGVSIVNACVKSAYDGLRLDGKEAALVAHNVKVSRNPDKWESQAEYFPMVRGLIKKILTSREVVSMEAEVIYEHDTYRVLRGTNPEIHHEPRLVGDRGKPIAYYSIATLKGGYRTAEIMTSADVADVRKEAKTAFVWDRWPGEMGKKSVIRRHEKKLPSGRDMVDVEAMAMFPQYDRTTPHPSLAAPVAAAPRPTRAAITDQQGTEFGMSFGNQSIDDRDDDREHVVVEQERSQQRQQEAPREQQGNQQQREPEVQLPEDDAAWGVWGAGLEKSITNSENAEVLDQIWREAQPILKHASKAIRDRITGKVTDRNADLALEGSDAGDAADN
jgi:phage RecT family recombinase